MHAGSISPEIFDLIQPHPPVLTEFQPKLKFWLLDEGKFSPAYLEGLQSVMAAIFRMEHPNDTEETKRAIRCFGQAVANSPFRERIGRAVTEWLRYRLNQKMPGLDIPEIDELLKGTQMLETRIDQMKANILAEGMQLGEIKGKLEGRLEGESTLLERQIAKRFGPISESTRSRLKAATSVQLETWAERILDAATLADVFGDH
ncbi:MAG: DUF4351 domain-containing protein [Rhodocyclaceae bacterium]|nr:DUF4351 domain-containing protein [Rhodocyclaceae bacterium]